MLGSLLLQIIEIIQIVLILRAICSWFPEVQRSQIGRFLYTITEPMLAPVRRALMGIDFFKSLPIDVSFLVVIILLNFVSALVITLF